MLHGQSPSVLAALGYDTVYTIAAAITKAGSLDSEAIVLALHNMEFTNTVSGDGAFDDNGDAFKEVAVIQIVNGEDVFVTRVKVD